ncbi:MAG: hypothetical protein Q9190_004224 [Brigantiaea leucoxantha]
MRLQPSQTPMRPMTNLLPLRRHRYSAARAFYFVVFAILVLSIWSLLSVSHGSLPDTAEHVILQRNVNSGVAGPPNHGVQLMKRDKEVAILVLFLVHSTTTNTYRVQCRLVHSVKDKCAFVQANCPDEEAGLFSYLQLYYCRMHRAKPVAFVIMVVWLGLLFSTIGIAASDFFCINLSTVASILGMSESMAGVTFLALGNGSPDVFSTFAAMNSHSGSLAIGELIGAAGFITAVVAGSMALVRPFKVARKSFVRDVGFFTVAASFSMVFLADGHLNLWECGVMVGFYLFYVITVVVWHWYLGKRRRLQEQEIAARAHFHMPGIDEAEDEPYLDDDEDRQAGGNRHPSRVSTEDFAALERGASPLLRAMDEETDEETRGHWMAEISSNMRISRPPRGERRNTANPIRPSLVGALEFRAVLSSLEKSKNIQTIPLNSRRYSDDPTYTTAQQQDRASTTSNPEISYDFVDAHHAVSSDPTRLSIDEDRGTAPARIRAVSADDATGLRLDTDVFRKAGSTRAIPIEGSTVSRKNSFGYLSTSPASISRATDTKPSPSLLAPPEGSVLSSSGKSKQGNVQDNQSENLLPPSSPNPNDMPSVPRLSTLSRSPSGTTWSSLASPFPEYHDDPNFLTRSRPPSIRLPPPSIGSESTYLQRVDQRYEERPVRWWPYRILPPPQILISALFPTLYSWGNKNLWEKLLGVVAAPSVLLLTITLPVVESERDENIPNAVDPDPGLLSPEHVSSRLQSTAVLPPDSPSIAVNGHVHKPELQSPIAEHRVNQSSGAPLISISEQTPDLILNDGQVGLRPVPSRQSSAPTLPSVRMDDSKAASSAKDWNRWLVATQIFTAPVFIVILVWGNTDSELKAVNLLLPVLYSLIASLTAFAILILTTTPSKPPRYRYLLCFLGFIVSIAWISTIANEVVGVLKAFGVILGISDAILGLTIFAVGNSLGDLVADITVARLGFPVMALSACFGGPMLNILLGIGLSGVYMTIQDGRHKHDKHPDRPIHYRPYRIDVSPTLIISGVTLLVTLLGLLLVVPLNKWRMDRRVGWGLVALWCASTVGNVIVEVRGWGRQSA